MRLWRLNGHARCRQSPEHQRKLPGAETFNRRLDLRRRISAMRRTAIAVTLAAILAAPGSASFAAGDFEGTWKVKDTSGKDFEITLAPDGTATATRGEGMTGT